VSGDFQTGVASYGRHPRTTRRPVRLEPVPDTCPQCGRHLHRDNPTAGCDTCTEENQR
jgi:hypothetical protein